MHYLNRTLFEASFSKAFDETEEEFHARIEASWNLACRVLGVSPIHKAAEVEAETDSGEAGGTR